jgi:hypothetical protein
MRRTMGLVLLGAVLGASLVWSSAAQAGGASCNKKSCLTLGEAPALGVYRFSQGASGPRYELGGRLTAGRTAAGYVLSDFRMWLSHKEGCSLNGHLATVEGAFPLRKKTKVTAFENGTKETSTTWKLPHRSVKVKVAGHAYPGTLFAAFIGAPPFPGATPSVVGSLTLTSSEGTVCGGSFQGAHGRKR